MSKAKAQQATKQPSSIKQNRKTGNIRPATRKQVEFARIVATEHKIPIKQAYKMAYNTDGYTSENAIEQEASRTLRNPSVVNELAKYSNKSEYVLNNILNDYGNSSKLGERSLAQDTAKYIHDKIHGKATQKIEQHSTSVNLNLDLTKMTE